MSSEKILILGPDFFNFVSAADNAFSALGCQTYTLPYTDFSFLQKCIMKFRCKPINVRVERRHKEHYALKVHEAIRNNGRIDLVFIMNGDFLDSKALDYLHKLAM